MTGRQEKKDADLCGDVLDVLEYYRALGFDRLPLPGLEGGIETAFRSAPDNGPSAAPARVKEAAPHRDLPVAASADERRGLLKELREEMGDCRRCGLAGQRMNIVFGEGRPDARLMFIGEAPGREEDIQGMPFVGDAGSVLTKLIEKMGMSRQDVYIANIIKCRPPMNRDPEDEEIITCRPFLEKQIRIIRPEVIMTLGRIALKALRGDPRVKITSARGVFFDYEGIPVMPTFHPAYLLRNPKDKWLTWADAQKVLERLEKGHTSDADD